ncbi:TRAP transporter substrate-binding protein DctP [Wenzhouxiangella sp. XN79A]|uniref:TRAP transporter substrate-binding protein DctP n=1 Tax=Wenzhouxiangella sp. XN79A TaxID=2724193 RepID=UPI00144AE5B5|nr:TRAP transporter substrate-binding protein DctP [Wenzhouxiangella sp. XN79A]NKI34467.1 TRAP transporter substrate-binding protein DctP [Wenzhouxiangella sp. XN79A]
MKSITFLLLLLLLMPAVNAQQLKIAALAPDGSSWMESLNAAGDRIEEASDGEVRIRFYPGGVMGDADTVLRRIRLGQLHGGVFTVGELAGVAPESNLYSLPFQFRNAEELAALRDEFDPLILDALYEGGMMAPAISNGGFAYLFSRQPFTAPADVSADLRVWIPEGDPLSRRTLERIGASAVPMSMAEVYTGLQTGTIDTFGSTVSGAIILQWHTRAKYMLDLPVLATAGTLAIDRKAFEKLDPAHQAIVRQHFGDALRAQEAAVVDENIQARAALVEEGIEILQPAPDGVEEWTARANAVLNEMLEAGEFEVPGLDRLRERLDELRGADASATP